MHLGNMRKHLDDLQVAAWLEDVGRQNVIKYETIIELNYNYIV